MQKRMIDDIERVLLSREQLHARVCQLAAQIERDYEGKDLVMVCVLNGAAVFYIDLLMEMDIPLEMNFIRVSAMAAAQRAAAECAYSTTWRRILPGAMCLSSRILSIRAIRLRA